MTERREEPLILKRDRDAVRSEGYDVFFEGRHVGASKAISGSDGPYGHVAILEVLFCAVLFRT